MSRSGYSDDVDNWALIRWRGQVASALRGRRGQRLLSDLVAALDAMPKQELITEELLADDGRVCALGAVGVRRGVVLGVDPDEPDEVAELLDIAPCLAQEVAYLNDETGAHETPANRWTRMRAWAVGALATAPREKP